MGSSAESGSFLTNIVQNQLSMNLDSEWLDAVLYVPYQNEQALLYEYADCIAVRAFFKMAGLAFKLEQRPNAEFMSPTKRVPFLRLQNVLVAEFGSIIEFVGKKGLKLNSTLTDVEKADLQAHLSLIEEVLRNAEEYICWIDHNTYNEVTRTRYGSVYLWPLYLILPYLKRRESVTRLENLGWGAFKSMDEVVAQCEKCFKALSVKLGNNRYFIGDQPTELDALAFGHLYTILTTELPNMRVANTLKRYQNLIDFCKRIDEEFFAK
uniref:Metaxin n=1 Tax=Ditylenchus dipsaci TaxID=166011 RepID=A0A915D2A3_9BILA